MTEITSILEAENHLQGITGVVFDLDDTLYSEKEYVRSGYRAVSEYLRGDYADRLWRLFEEGKPAIDELLRELGRTEEKKAALTAYRFHMPDIHLYDGVPAMLRRLRSGGRKIGIITDGRPEGQRAKIQTLGLSCLVDEIIITDELGGVEYRKPNTAAFERMQKRMEIPYARMVYIGDNPKKDFQAPEMLGMMSIWFRNKDGLYQ